MVVDTIGIAGSRLLECLEDHFLVQDAEDLLLRVGVDLVLVFRNFADSGTRAVLGLVLALPLEAGLALLERGEDDFLKQG